MAPALRFVLCGSVDDGKSTLIGRILYDCRQVFTDQLERVEEDSRRYGTQGRRNRPRSPHGWPAG